MLLVATQMQQYGIYANGLLSESMSINAFEIKKQLKPLF